MIIDSTLSIEIIDFNPMVYMWDLVVVIELYTTNV